MAIAENIIVAAVQSRAAWICKRASHLSRKEEKNFKLPEFLVNYYKPDMDCNFTGGSRFRRRVK